MGQYGLAVRAICVGRRTLCAIVSIGTPDTLLRWHRQLVARTWTSRLCRGRRVILAEIERLVVRMADENPTWGATRESKGRYRTSGIGWAAPRLLGS